MTSSKTPAATLNIPQSNNGREPIRTTFASLPRELRDKIYGYIVIAGDRVVAVSARATEYGDCKEFHALRTILHASTSNTQFAREAYEVFFHQNTFRINAESLAHFVNRSVHHLKNEGHFDVGAWLGRLEVTVGEAVLHSDETRDKVADQLRQLLICRCLHTVVIRIDCHKLREEQHVYDFLRPIAEVCAQLQRKIGEGFVFETKGNESWGNGKEKPLLPYILSP